MGRKKKTKDEIKTEEKQSAKNPSSTIGYKGNIKVSIARGNKIISTKEYHNNGRDPLWRFLSYCIVGDLRGIETWRPNYIIVGNNAGQIGNFDQFIQCSLPILKTKVQLDHASNKNTAVLHFRIPYAYIIKDITDTPINEFWLVCETELTTKNPSAFFRLEGDAVITEIGENYNLIIDWEMSFNNAEENE